MSSATESNQEPRLAAVERPAESADAALAQARGRYARLLGSHVRQPGEEWLAQAADLGRELVEAGVAHEDLVELHDLALERLCTELPDLRLAEAARVATEPLMELQMAYGLEHRRQLEESRRINRALTREIEERRRAERELEQKAQELERSNEDLLQFASVASHDLQAPLRSIAGFIGLLTDPTFATTEAQRRRMLDTVAESAARMQRLIVDLLGYARAGSAELAMEPVDLDEVMGQVVADLGPQIRETGAQVTWEALPSVRGSRSLLPHVLQNLVGNALKFHGATTPRVRVSARLLPEGTPGHRWEVSVHDNGIGIEERHLGRIFRPFERLHPQDRYPGSGIGLALCARIVERHGERITVQSTPGEGSRFSFTCRGVAGG